VPVQPDVAHQVEQTRGVAHALARDRIHRDRCQRHEQHRHPGTLRQLRPEDVPVTGLQVQLRQPEQRDAAGEQPAGQELSCVEAAGHHADDRHHEKRSDAARRHRNAGLERGIAEHRL